MSARSLEGGRENSGGDGVGFDETCRFKRGLRRIILRTVELDICSQNVDWERDGANVQEGEVKSRREYPRSVVSQDACRGAILE